jgi:hypothetical protein
MDFQQKGKEVYSDMDQWIRIRQRVLREGVSQGHLGRLLQEFIEECYYVARPYKGLHGEPNSKPPFFQPVAERLSPRMCVSHSIEDTKTGQGAGVVVLN